jgi:hypothetical protein
LSSTGRNAVCIGGRAGDFRVSGRPLNSFPRVPKLPWVSDKTSRLWWWSQSLVVEGELLAKGPCCFGGSTGTGTPVRTRVLTRRGLNMCCPPFFRTPGCWEVGAAFWRQLSLSWALLHRLQLDAPCSKLSLFPYLVPQFPHL